MSNLSTLPKGDSAWLLRKAIERIIEQVSVLETNIGSSTTGNSLNGQIIFNDNGTLRGDTGLTYTKATTTLRAGLLIVPGNTQLATVGTLYVGSLGAPKLKVDVAGTGITTITEATITGAATVGTTLGVTGVSTLTGNAFANGSATVSGGTPGAFANAALTINNRGGVSDLSLIALGYRPNGTILNGAAYIGFITTSGSGNVLGDLIFGTRSVTTDTAPLERYRIDSTGISTWSVAGTTAMTLNSTGLGVGASPTRKLSVSGAGGGLDVTDTTQSTRIRMRSSSASNFYIEALNSAESAYVTLRLNDTTQIDASGNCGIGVAPSAWSTYKAIQVGQIGAFWANPSGTDVYLSANQYFGSASDRYIANGLATIYKQNAGVHSWLTAPSGTAGNAITFTQAMTLDASGNLLVSQSTAGVDAQGGLFLRNAASSGGSSIIINHRNSVVSNNSFAEFTHNGSLIGSILQNGTTGVTFNTSSDYRLKESVKPLSDGLARVSALKPSVYNWKSDGSIGEGFLAHELAEVVPLAVTGEKDAVNEDGSIKPQQVDLSKVVPVLVAAIQELAARVQTLETR